jgi:hypothetical protein
MRWFASFVFAGTLVSGGGVYAQSLAEHAAAAAGATVGTAAGKPISNALTSIFGQVDQTTATAAAGKGKPKTTATIHAEEKTSAPTASAPVSSGGGGGGGLNLPSGAPAQPRARAARSASNRQAPALPVAVQTYVPVVVEPPRREPTAEELASIKIGTTERELVAALGTPESHVIVPDDDGHLRESCQYWAQGRHLGTVRLDNGQVVKIELRAQN